MCAGVVIDAMSVFRVEKNLGFFVVFSHFYLEPAFQYLFREEITNTAQITIVCSAEKGIVCL